MRLDKSRKILINMALILLLALLVKFLVAIPNEAQAKTRYEYKFVDVEEFGGEMKAKALTQYVNQLAQNGWRLHSLVPWAEVVIFER